MSIQGKFYSLEALQKLRKQIGEYSFIRFLKNRGVSFSLAYYIMFQRVPQRF